MSEKADPAYSFAAVTKSDTTNLGAARAFYIGVTGDVALKANAFSPAVTFKAVPVGILPVSAQIVMSANTTATDIVALY